MTCESSPETSTAIVFADDYHDAGGFTPALAPVGSLPIILRAILEAQTVHATRIIVASSRLADSVIRRDLSRTGRLPETVEWFEVGASPGSVPQLLGRIAANSDRIVLVSGCVAYHPCLFETIRHWDGQGEAAALTTASQFAGIAALSRHGALAIARDCPADVDTPMEVFAWFMARHSVVSKAVQENLWQSVNAPNDRLLAEGKLNNWLGTRARDVAAQRTAKSVG